MKNKDKLLASSSTIVGLQGMLNKYYYSTTYQIFPDFTITNSKGIFEKVYVVKKGSRYYLYQK